MKKIDLDINLDKNKMPPAEKEFFEAVGYSGGFETLFIQGLTSLYPSGIPLVKGKHLARIQRKLDANGSTINILEVEESEFDLIKSVFCGEDTRFSAPQMRVVLMYSEKVEKAESL